MNFQNILHIYALLILLFLITLEASGQTLQNSSSNQEIVSLPGKIPMSFTLIEGGTYWMGSPDTEAGRDPDESPRREIELTHDFLLGTYEVTQEQWLAIMGNNPAIFQQTGDHLLNPVENVSWNDCQIFIDKLNTLGIGFFRLPTEAEWEYACRAGTETRFYWGEDAKENQSHQFGWINSRSMATPHPVGQKKPNPWGLYDMSGNVWEWCSDTYSKYGKSPKTDTLKVFRGGSWYDFTKSQRSANRHKHGWNERYPAIGLRLVLEKRVQVLPIKENLTMRFVHIPKGTFTMGSDSNDAFFQNDEFPAHEVEISKDFWIGQFEVTQAQWLAIMDENPSVFHRGKDALNRPVDMVSWDDCQQFIDELNKLGIGTFRLPTEAEWEYACRAGTTDFYPWGKTLALKPIEAHAWFNSRAAGQSHPVGAKKPNPWGLYDMHGNVWEWCEDWRGAYIAGKQLDPQGPQSGTRKIYRGGSWFNEPEALRSSNRHGHPPDLPFTNAGLRLVWEEK